MGEVVLREMHGIVTAAGPGFVRNFRLVPGRNEKQETRTRGRESR